jgi:hypothetical protein
MISRRRDRRTGTLQALDSMNKTNAEERTDPLKGDGTRVQSTAKTSKNFDFQLLLISADALLFRLDMFLAVTTSASL